MLAEQKSHAEMWKGFGRLKPLAWRARQGMKKDNKQTQSRPVRPALPLAPDPTQLECTHCGWLILRYCGLATSLGQERMFLSFLNTSRWLCPFAVTIMEWEYDKDWKWHTPNPACPGASLSGSATVTSSSITPGFSVPEPMTPVRNFQVSACFFIRAAWAACTRKGWHLGWGRNGQCLPLSAPSNCQFGFSHNISKFRPSRLVI